MPDYIPDEWRRTMTRMTMIQLNRYREAHPAAQAYLDSADEPEPAPDPAHAEATMDTKATTSYCTDSEDVLNNFARLARLYPNEISETLWAMAGGDTPPAPTQDADPAHAARWSDDDVVALVQAVHTLLIATGESIGARSYFKSEFDALRAALAPFGGVK